MDITENSVIETPSAPERPEFLKILCILSFVACGLWILIYSIGSLTLTLGQATVDEIWPQVVKNYPQFEDTDGTEFMRQFGLTCIYGLMANLVCLIGVIMMWRLQKVGFYIYVLAEMIPYFVKGDVVDDNPGVLSLVFSILIDLTFVILYFVNLKHMKGKTGAL